MSGKNSIVMFAAGAISSAILMAALAGRGLPRANAQQPETKPATPIAVTTPGLTARYQISSFAYTGSYGAYVIDTQEGTVWVTTLGNNALKKIGQVK